MQAVEGIYQNGVIVALEPLELNEGDKVKIFISYQRAASPETSRAGESLADLGEILNDDLEAASLEIRQQFLAAIEKSGAEVQK